MKSLDRSWKSLTVFLALSFIVAAAGGLLTMQSVRDWYPTLEKPSWTPPDWVFSPVWTVLYILMAVAAWWVWRCGPSRAVTVAIALYGVQLALNGLWTPVFFGLHQILAGLVVLSLLWVALLATVIAFLRIKAGAAMLLLPYLAWSTYAWTLNFQIWRIN